MLSFNKRLVWLTLFSIAMGFLETTVVVYLRELYYPAGFQFPLVPIAPKIALTEFLREAATLIMLLGIGILSGRNRQERLAFGIFAFAVWDIFYYIFLWLLLGWPESLFTWDILFLIPFPWIGPVLAPCLVSALMIIYALCVTTAVERAKIASLNKREFILLTVGTSIIFISFLWEYGLYLWSLKRSSAWTPASEAELFGEMSSYVPVSFNWILFLAGFLLSTLSVWFFYRRLFVLKNNS